MHIRGRLFATAALAGAASLGAALSAGASEGESDDDLMRRLNDLQARIEAYKAREGGSAWMTESRAAEIRALAMDVIEDASLRRSLLTQDDVEYTRSPYGSGFFYIPGTDTALKIGGYVQHRYFRNDQDEDAAEDTSRGGFETRARLTLRGDFGQGWSYKVQGAFNGQNEDFELEDSYADYWCDDPCEEDFDGFGMGVRAGQFRVPFTREELVDDPYLLAVERSLVNEQFSLGRSQGVSVLGQFGQLRTYFTYSDGANYSLDLNQGHDNTPWGEVDTEYAFTARAEYACPEGSRWPLRTHTWGGGLLNDQPRVDLAWLVGGGIHHQKDEVGLPGPEETETTAWTADVSVEGGGFNAFGAYVGGHVRMGDFSYTQHGFVAQGGYRFDNNIEPFVRYEFIDFDDAFGADETSIVTGGFNYYLNGNSLKLTVDAMLALDPIPFNAQKLGLRQDLNDEDGQWVVRLQTQLAF